MDLDHLTKDELVSELARRGEDIRGRKPVLQERLTQLMKEEEFQSQGARKQAKEETGKLHEEREPKKADDEKGVKSRSSRSGGGSAASSRPASSVRTSVSIASARALERAKLAGLSAKKGSLKKRHQIEEEEAGLRRQREELEIQVEIDESKAKKKVLEEMLKVEDATRAAGMWLQGAAAADTVQPQEAAVTTALQDAAAQQETTSPAASPQAATPGSVLQDEPTQQQVAGRAQPQHSTDLHLVRRLHLPSLDLTTFRGDTSKFRPFLRTFESNIARKVDCDAERLLYLLKFTRGKPHDLVQTCVHLPEEQGYAQAVKLLRRRYDCQAQTVASLVDEMLALPTLRAEERDGLDDFGIFLRGCMNALESLPHGVGSVDSKTIRRLLEKLPYHLTERWRRKADAVEQEERRPANFSTILSSSSRLKQGLQRTPRTDDMCCAQEQRPRKTSQRWRCSHQEG